MEFLEFDTNIDNKQKSIQESMFVGAKNQLSSLKPDTHCKELKKLCI